MKYLLTISLAATAALAYAKDNGPHGRVIITNKGDKIMMEPMHDRTVHIANKDVSSTVTVGDQRPLLLNGKEIYYFKDHKEDPFGLEEMKLWKNEYAKLNEQIDKTLAEEKKQLPDGYYEYRIEQMVVDEQGAIVYYQPKSLVRLILKEDKIVPAEIPAASAQIVEEKIKSILNTYRYTPFMHQGKATPYLSSYSYLFNVGYGQNEEVDRVIKKLKEQIKKQHK